MLELERDEVVAMLLELREVEVDTTLLEVVTATLLELRDVEVEITLLEVAGTLELLGRELEVAGTLELLGRELEVAGVELLDGVELLAPTMPKGAGCAAQVEREIQLLLFS